jgi:acyl-coenzyme A synthetase/AMP-(fatty) acid ligase
MLANATSIAEYLSINEHERPITTLPMSYSFGLSIINSHFIKGATLLLTSKTLMQKEFWAFLKTQKATSLSGVPYTYEILKKLRFFRMELPSLITLTQAGGKLNNELNKEFSEFCLNANKRFFVMYGQTEATARMSYLPSQYSLTKLGSMGIAIPGGEFSIIDEKGTNIEGPEIIGELVYKGKNVSLGYAECGDDLKKEDENHGILCTGDIAKRDSDNFYYIVGRKKRFIKIYGNRVNLDETERLLKNIVPDCACAGEDDHMIIYITDKTRADEVRNYISSKTGINHAAFSVRHIAEIPKNSSGKTIYSKLDIS